MNSFPYLAAGLLLSTPWLPAQVASRDIVLEERYVKQPVALPRAYALVVGVSDYKNLPPKQDLRFAERDAEAIYNVLISPEGAIADLLPREEEEVARILAHEDTALPAFCIRGAAGENVLWFLVTTDPQRARDFRGSLRQKPPTELASRDVIVETEKEEEAKVSNAVYRKSAGTKGEQLFRIVIRQE